MALLSAILILLVLILLGAGLLSFADSQQRASFNEQQSESAFALAEAALNAQIFELSVQWPTSVTNATYHYSSSCNAASNGAGDCPAPGYLSSSYPITSTSCPTGTPGDSWSGSPASNGWTTYVRDAGSTSSTENYFNSSLESSAVSYPPYDASLNGALWVRAVGIVNCHMAVVVSKVSAQYVALNFPHDAFLGNGFETSNNGNGSGAIIDTQGSAPQPAPVQMRCTGLGNEVGPNTTCTNYQSGQVSPDTTSYAPTIPLNALTPQQLLAAAAQAKANGTYWGAGQCPTAMAQLTGAPTYIVGPCNMSFTGNDTANSQAKQGFLVIQSGTIYFGGTVQFYGVVYDVNQQGCPNGNGSSCPNGSDVVTLHGNAHLYGGIVVDTTGTINGGSSHKGNFTYDPTAINNSLTWGGAAGTPNSFRQLPVTQ